MTDILINNHERLAVQHIQYLPFGEIFVSQRNDWFDSRYKFTAKEHDNETNYTYFGARYYDSDLSSWLSVDPLAAARPNLSPYNYCQNNPVVRIDPTGMLDDEWDLYPNGKVKHANNNGGETYHSLHAVDENGNRTGNSIIVRNRDVLDGLDATKNDLTSISKRHSTGSIDDVYNVFKFGADNSSVEWATARYNDDQYAIWTGNIEVDSKSSIHQYVASTESVDLTNINASLHSHPNINKTSERFSIGEGNTGYFPNSGNLYHITKSKILLNSNMSNYKDLYFGVFNHR